jgi:hypothetical protein
MAAVAGRAHADTFAQGSGRAPGREAPRYRRPVGRPRLPVLGAVAGVVTGLLVATLLVTSGRLDDRATATPAKPATAAFLAAFQRSLLGTYAVDATYTRRKDGVGTLTSRSEKAQAPPNHLTREFGGVTGAMNGYVIGCSMGPGGKYLCSPTKAREDYSVFVATAMHNLRSYFAARGPLYSVVASGKHCFDLTQVGELATAPYGTFAHMCFDPATGAMSYLRENLEDATDTFDAVQIRSQVTAGDFSLAADPETVPHLKSNPP